MKIQTTGRFISVCEPNQGRTYDENGRLLTRSLVTGRARKLNKKLHARKLRREVI